MATSVEISFVGLCSFLNMHDSVAHMPPPSVVMHRAYPHMAFIAWKDSEAVFSNTGNMQVEHTDGGTNYLELDNEQLFLNDDQSGPPTVESSYDDHVAHIKKYANLSAVPIFDQDHVPLKGHLPDGRAEAAYLEFGKGTIKSDWDTPKQYVFRDKNSAAIDKTPAKYHRRVKYSYNTSADALVVIAVKYDNSSRRKLIFKPKSGTMVTVWMGNSMDIDEDMNPSPTVVNKKAEHFKFFYDTLAIKPATIYIPVVEGSVSSPGHEPAEGAGTGYCGPDGQP